MKPKKYLAVVMDAGHARLLTKLGRTGHWTELRDFRADGHHHAGQSGTSHESMGSARHGVHPHSDPHRLDKKDFADQMAGRLAEITTAEAPDAVVLVAPPAVLGDLRRMLAPSVNKLITADLAKDFVKIPIRELTPRLDDLAGIWPAGETEAPDGRATVA